MDSRAPRRRNPSLFSASGLFLLAAAGHVLLWIFSPYIVRGLCVIAPGLSPEWLNLIISVLFNLPFMFLPVLAWATHREGAADNLRLNALPVLSAITIVLSALLCVMLALNINELWAMLWQRLGLNVFENSYVVPANTGELMRSIIASAIIVPISEELLMRGVIFPAWEPRGTRLAIVLSAFLFMLLHASILGIPAQFLLGMIIAYFVFITDSIYAGMIFHSVYNAAILLLQYSIAKGFLGTPSASGQAENPDLFLLIGGLNGILSLLMQCAMIGLVLWFILRSLTLNGRLRGLQETPRQKRPFSTGETLLLLSGITTCVMLYILTTATLLGG